jgi:UDP-glucose 4-epimerase
VENLVPIVINKLKAGEPPVIYGTDYPTPDGTCVRDYVDVRDIAGAHLAVADSTKELPLALNVGTGNGASVRRVIDLISSSFEAINPEVIENERRSGDPAILCASPELLQSNLAFTAECGLNESIQSLSR